VEPARIVVATDDERIATVCRAEGMAVVLTSPGCLTGTDRVAEVAERDDATTFINVQGDEPLFDPRDLEVVLEAARRHPEEIINGFAPIDSEEQFRRSSVPKVVMREDGRLLYMSRAGVPTTTSLAFERGMRQVGVYAYPSEALRAFRTRGSKTPLEQLEDIEILRFLEMGFEVRMIGLSGTSISVDEPEDVERVLARMSSHGQGPDNAG